MKTSRLFIALKLPEEIKRQIISIRDEISAGDKHRNWELPEKLHLTMKFLGDVDNSKNEQIESVIEKLASDFSHVQSEFDRFGFFMPRILWLGLRVEQHLFDMIERLNFDLEKIGFEKEIRNFKPHITILRIKENLNPDFVSKFKNYKMPSDKFNLSEIALMESRLQRSGSAYSELKNFNLK
jgi:2'-5' RNA ligase